MGLALGASGVALAACSDDDPAAPTPSDPTSTTAQPTRRQQGVDAPVPRQRYAAIRVATITDPTEAETLLTELGTAITALPRTDNLTVTVGVGPEVVKAARGADFIGAEDLPEFASDAIEDDARGGDLLLQVCADRKATVLDVATTLLASLAGRATTAWEIDGYRGEVEGVAARNVLGFFDGIAVPTTPEDLSANVWTDETDGLADATVCVVRRIRLDHRRFGLLPVAEQDAVFGRHKRSGTPLSGGGILADVNLQAKSDDGVFDIANDAHVRRAHPLFSGAGKLMMRRGYSYRAAPDDQGLAFICFQRELQMFVRTQNSMDGGDRLLDFATTTGSGTFLVLPAWTDDDPLGASLWP